MQSAVLGMGLSLVAMGFAAFAVGCPAYGALLQEGIDLAVILNALRALRTERGDPDAEASTQRNWCNASAVVVRTDARRSSVLREAAQQVSAGDRSAGLQTLRIADDFLQDTLLPHEDAEDKALYPALAGRLGGPEATATMSRMHGEIHRLAQRLHSHRGMADAAGAVTDEQSDDLLACLYGLYALLCLHFVQEEENFSVLAPNLDQ